MAKETAITRVGIIGVGTMGGALALLFAENGLDVSISDIWDANLDKTVKKAEAAGLGSRIHVCRDYDSLCRSLGTPKVFVFSLPNGRPGDAVVAELQKHVVEGDIVVDASNENYRVTQARQEKLRPLGASYIGLGVSGGSFGARHGPSLMPGGDKSAVDKMLPILTKIAARDDNGRPCVANIGTGGSGHFVKMIHNGIEHGVMSALCEAWDIMDKCLGMSGDEIGSVFDSWCADGELKNNFLVSISGPICRTKAPGNKTVNGHTNGHATDSNSHSPYLVHRIRDAVVQDANDSEGTGVWANLQAVSSHVPAPSLTASHYMRIASADVHQRAAIRDSIGTVSPQPFEQAGPRRAEYLEQLRQAVYLATLVCFVQGLAVLERDNAREGWGIDVLRVLEIWRAGCIIKSDYVSDLLEGSYKSLPLSRNGTAGQESAEVDARNHPLCRPAIAADVKRNWPALKAIVLEAVRADAHVPCLGATLDYLKYSGNTDLPTCFTEAQLDSFGAHGFDLRSEPVRHLQKGVYHDEWSG